MNEEFEDTKGVIRIHKWKDRQHNGQKDKQRSTIKHGFFHIISLDKFS